MKNFDDFVSIVNNSDDIQKRLIKSTNINLRKLNNASSNEEALAEIIYELQSSMMRGSMELLSEYHKWINQPET